MITWACCVQKAYTRARAHAPHKVVTPLDTKMCSDSCTYPAC